MKPSLRSQRGQMLIGAVLAIGLLALVLAGVLRVWRTHQIQARANAYGQTLAQFAVGLRGYIAAAQGGTVTLPANPYTVNGVNWLKPPSCGGAASNPAAGFVPCTFDGGLLGPQYRTTVTQAGTAIEARTFVFVPRDMVGVAGVGSLAAATTEAALAQQALPANGTFYTVLANTAANATGPVGVSGIAPANRGRVMAIVNNSPSNDVWLRTDGTNMMLGDLNMGGRSLTNAKNGAFSGNVTVNGAASITGATTLANTLTVNSATTLKSALSVAGAAKLNGGATVNGDVTVNGGGQVSAKDFYMNGMGLYASQAFYKVQTVRGSAGYNITKPNCGAYGNNPQIYAALQGSGSAASAASDALYESRVSITDLGSYWHLQPIVRATKFTITKTGSGTDFQVTLNKSVKTVNSTDQEVVVWTRCG